MQARHTGASHTRCHPMAALTPRRPGCFLGPFVSLACATVLMGCPTVDLGEEPQDPPVCRPNRPYFDNVIWPDYIEVASDATRSCTAQAGCHDISDGRSSFRLETTAPVDLDTNYAVVTRFLNCSAPESSSMLTKPAAGSDPHGGGDLFSADGSPGTPTATFLRWFEL